MLISRVISQGGSNSTPQGAMRSISMLTPAIAAFMPRPVVIFSLLGLLTAGLPARAQPSEFSASGQLAQYEIACVGPVYSDGSVGIQFHAEDVTYTSYCSCTDLRLKLWWSADDTNYTKIYKVDDAVLLGVTVDPGTAPQYYPGYFRGCVQNYYYSTPVRYNIWIGPVTSPNAWCPPTGIC